MKKFRLILKVLQQLSNDYCLSLTQHSQFESGELVGLIEKSDLCLWVAIEQCGIFARTCNQIFIYPPNFGQSSITISPWG